MRPTLKKLGLLTVLAGALAACADPAGGGGGAGADASPSPKTEPTSLTITVTPDQGAKAQVWTLSCEPSAAGTHPKATEACAFVSKSSPALLGPVRAGQACTQIFGGPATATIKGSWRGEPVDAMFARNNGCEIARWNNVKALLGDGNS